MSKLLKDYLKNASTIVINPINELEKYPINELLNIVKTIIDVFLHKYTGILRMFIITISLTNSSDMNLIKQNTTLSFLIVREWSHESYLITLSPHHQKN